MAGLIEASEAIGGADQGMDFEACVHATPGFDPGKWFYVQTVTPNRKYTRQDGNVWAWENNGKVMLDRQYPYDPRSDAFDWPYDQINPADGYANDGESHKAGDSPKMGVDGDPDDPSDICTRVEVWKESFTMYLMFRPPGTNSREIPLRSVNWDWSADASRVGPDAPWTMAIGLQPPHFDAESAKFPPPPQWVGRNDASVHKFKPIQQP